MTSTARTTNDWLDAARSLATLVAKYRDQGERERRLPDPIYEAARDAGLFRLWLPREYGGYEVDMETMLRVVEEIARLDGAVGWNVMIGAESGAFFACLRLSSHQRYFVTHLTR
jgi:indole-3-acetate monooxygenase